MSLGIGASVDVLYRDDMDHTSRDLRTKSL